MNSAITTKDIHPVYLWRCSNRLWWTKRSLGKALTQAKKMRDIRIYPSTMTGTVKV